MGIEGLVIVAAPRALGETRKQFCTLTGAAFTPPNELPRTGGMILWRAIDNVVVVVRPHPPVQCHVRHAGKYATGDVGPERSLYFWGKDNAVFRRANNLFAFLDVDEQVDEAVWNHHL